MKKECPSCAMMVENRLNVCPICQYEFTESKRSKLPLIAILLALLFLISLLF